MRVTGGIRRTQVHQTLQYWNRLHIIFRVHNLSRTRQGRNIVGRNLQRLLKGDQCALMIAFARECDPWRAQSWALFGCSRRAASLSWIALSKSLTLSAEVIDSTSFLVL